ncbi:hypothetical protein GV819_17075 [Pseudomonas sp. Fl5BN2]|uniref:hypothetical protein n=1 Tax=unclassified Pseudomonas TaxID=196821 RepID=UPI001377A622|nr:MULTISPECIES: hypothetical protein [unclassified Pseudomonas]NBF04001.1 hypothetical protein [Pseudomonas sp. Fl5BN2]NBF09753.1 hypothetical protein [Pseudomonas sp. Fl4BN1]
MSIGAVSASNPVTINGQGSAQNPPTTKATQATSTATSNVEAALKEATETAAQTAQEAGHGDRQAQRLIQKHHHQTASTAAPASGVVNGSGQITGEIINTKA